MNNSRLWHKDPVTNALATIQPTTHHQSRPSGSHSSRMQCLLVWLGGGCSTPSPARGPRQVGLGPSARHTPLSSCALHPRAGPLPGSPPGTAPTASRPRHRCLPCICPLTPRVSVLGAVHRAGAAETSRAVRWFQTWWESLCIFAAS